MNAPVSTITAKKRIGSRLVALPPLRVPVRDDEKKIIPIFHLNGPVEVVVPKSADLKDGDFLSLYRDGASFGVKRPLTQAELNDPTITEFILKFEVADFPAQGTDETVKLDYFVDDPSSGDGQPSGLPLDVRFDRRAAGGEQLGPIAFSSEQQSGITVSDLIDGLLPVAIKSYRYGEADDIIELWIGRIEGDESSGIWLPATFTVNNPELTTFVTYTKAELEAAGDGRHFFAYRVTDWAGNRSGISYDTGIDVFLQLPSLLAPVVPEFDDDGLVTFTDANPNVGVAIPQYPGAAERDEIIVYWGGVPLPPYPLSLEDAQSDPVVTINVPLVNVQNAGNGAIAVRYEMRRTGQPPVQSPVTDVQVNLETPGGPDPDPKPELPYHDNIKAPLIKCGTSADDTIEAKDWEKNATATIFRAGKDNNPIWKRDDTIQLFWQNISEPAIPPVPITASLEPANIPIDIDFKKVIDVTGAGVFDVYFTLTRLLPPNDVPVTVRSPIKQVSVVAPGALPGDGDPLAQGQFPDANESYPYSLVQRDAGLRGTMFRIPLQGVTNIEIDKNPMISYDFVGIEPYDAATPVNGGVPPDPPFTSVEASRVQRVDVLLTQADLDLGYYDVPLPYTLTYYICRRWATLDYTIRNDFGPVSATQKFVYFALNPRGEQCTVP